MLTYVLTMRQLKFLPMFIAVSNLLLANAQNVTTPAPGKLSESALLAAIIVPCVVGGLILIGIMAFIFIKIRERRQTEGTYRPSSEEHKEPRVEPNMALKLPPEERLI
ncbi:protein crumbs homolog 3 isoform X1 [Xenopus laevis]|uniref:protein crumbs homolog 3 isoform X1 n=1 Tax=Xenopus laevis TaxID=8355 RepID=A0A8J0U2B3_XENLA|nr:protein crumbs homolog 3 isoform X1 [Xenopus laevis]XP_018095148.1 protein crumbs homolog 3 isoform X1 [Xenopus laevis]